MAKDPANPDAPIVAEQLESIVERIEKLEDEKASISEGIKEVYSEAKSVGFDPKVLRKIIADRKLERDERAEIKALYDLYAQALNME